MVPWMLPPTLTSLFWTQMMVMELVLIMVMIMVLLMVVVMVMMMVAMMMPMKMMKVVMMIALKALGPPCWTPGCSRTTSLTCLPSSPP